MAQKTNKTTTKRDFLEIEKVGKSYNGKIAVSNFSMNCYQGEIVGLLGPNGAGKSTSFYMITGLIKADYGRILLNKEDISQYSIHERGKMGISYLPQEMSIFRELTAFENIMAIAEINNPNIAHRRILVENLLEEFNIGYLRNVKGIALSGGERRRVEIARSLATEPRFILFDEPFAGVDPISVSAIHELIVHLKQRGIGIIITDHNIRETLEIIDRAYIIFDGKVLLEGTAEKIIEDKTVKKYYLGEKFKF